LAETVEVHPVLLTIFTLNVPAVFTTILCVVALLFQRYVPPVPALLEVNTVLSPVQNAVMPVIVGVARVALCVTLTAVELADWQPRLLVTFTDTVLGVFTEILCVVALLLQRYVPPVPALLAVKVVLPAKQ
jgi:hypothetical protein